MQETAKEQGCELKLHVARQQDRTQLEGQRRAQSEESSPCGAVIEC
jgi:hypothetical protein